MSLFKKLTPYQALLVVVGIVVVLVLLAVLSDPDAFIVR